MRFKAGDKVICIRKDIWLAKVGCIYEVYSHQANYLYLTSLLWVPYLDRNFILTSSLAAAVYGVSDAE